MRLDELREGKHFGSAQVPGHPDLLAEFLLQGRETYVQVHGSRLLGRELHDLAWLPVVLPDGTRVTFVQNVLVSLPTWQTADGPRYAAKFMPHFAVVGDKHVDGGTKFSTVSLRVEDAPTIFYDFDAFSIASRPEAHMAALVASQEEVIKRKIRRGDRPIVAYFTGRLEIFSAQTALGRISAHHRPSHSMGGPQGVRIGNRIVLNTEPWVPVGLDEIIDLTMPVLRFLLIVAGRRQEILDLYVERSGAKRTRPMEVYWCLKPPSPPSGSESPSPGDIPINGGIDPQDFGRILTAWLATDESRRDARQRYSTAFAKGNRYDEDRIVGAANMFDILPPDAVPQAVDLSDELRAAQDAARKLFKALPKSLERSSILGDLGRLGRASLKRKVRHRAQILLASAAGRLAELELVLDEAVECRNHFVHGPATDASLADSFRAQMPFLSDTLEFVFAASEFVEAGWNLSEWASHGTSQTHPWGTYMVSYGYRLAELKAHVALRKTLEKASRRGQLHGPDEGGGEARD